MEAKTTSSRMFSLTVLYDMHTDFFGKVLDGISDKDTHNRLNTKANHIAWLAGSLIQQRIELANLLGGTSLKQGADELFKNFQGIKDDVQYPSLEEYKKEWVKISPVLREQLIKVSDEKLDSIFDMPQMKMPYFDLIAFNIHRESYFIGQIGLWRRLLGYEGMKYQ